MNERIKRNCELRDETGSSFHYESLTMCSLQDTDKKDTAMMAILFSKTNFLLAKMYMHRFIQFTFY